MSELVLDDGRASLVLAAWDDAPPDKPEYYTPFAIDAVFDVCGLRGGIGTILLNAEDGVAALRAMQRDGAGVASVKSLGSEPDLVLEFELTKNGGLKVLATITPGRNCLLKFHINLDQSYLSDIASGLRDLRE
jgi:hypothetical protein